MYAATNLVVLVTPAKDVPGQWIAHCLNLDVVTQGNSFEHALEMAKEAIMLVVADDLAAGLDPLDREQAPDKYWELLTLIARKARPLSSIEDKSTVRAVLVQFRIEVPADSLPPVTMIPEPWQLAALEDFRNSSPVSS